MQGNIPLTFYQVTGASLFILSTFDIVIHIWLDWRKLKLKGSIRERETAASTPSGPLIAASLSTILSFVLVLATIYSWISGGGILFLRTILIITFFQEGISWTAGYAFTVIGILLHVWSRYARQEMASSWAMDGGHKLVTGGPYALMRHPSYTSYMMCFIGLFFLFPSLVTLLLLPGIPGYYFIARAEEDMLLDHFGEEYEKYMEQTAMFLPRIR